MSYPTRCWEWQGARVQGYGRVRYQGQSRLVHRIAYQLLVGDIPAGLELDHLCRNRACYNPAHLEPVTRHVNIMRGDGPRVQSERQRAKTHCPHGHEYSESNTYLDVRGCRNCRTCRNAAARRHYRKVVSRAS